MSALSSFTHFETFARLHRASPADLPRLKHFAEKLSAGRGNAPRWARLIDAGDAHVLIATECDVIVGVGVLRHAPSGAVGSLAWLCVAPDARGRGVGTLLLETLIDRARLEGAALLEVRLPAECAGLDKLLYDAGFRQAAGDDWHLSLWNAQRAPSYCELAVPEHFARSASSPAVRALFLAMGTLDRDMLLTDQAEKVLGFEAGQLDRHPEALRLALVAARRRFLVTLRRTAEFERAALPLEAPEWINLEDEPLTPERLVGHLSRGHLPMLHVGLKRLGREARWYLVTGFDGYLFALNDPAGPGARALIPVTAAEMRLALSAATPNDTLILAKVL
jgi:GNAT superfamily N-acetyltransferase